MRSGIIQQLPIADYHADPALSKSGLKLLLERTPAHYFYQYRTEAGRKPKKTSKDKAFGQALHDFVLEPAEFKSRYTVAPPINKNTTAYKTLRKEIEAAGRVFLPEEDMEKVTEMHNALVSHPEARVFIPSVNSSVEVETSYFTVDPATGLRCKCRTDMRIPEWRKAGDLKSCLSAKEEDFTWDIMNYGYDIQDASYTSVMNTMEETEIEDFTFVCVEKEPPWCIALWTLPPAYKQRGYAEYRRAISIAAECEKTGTWPGYHPGVRQIMPPTKVISEYGFAQEEEDENEPEEYSQTA